MNRRRTFILILSIIGVIAACVCTALLARVPIPEDSAGKIAVYTRNKPRAEVTVAVISGKDVKISAYGHDGTEITVPERSYELGAITQTFTGAIAAKAVEDRVLRLETPVSAYLPLSRGTYSPTVSDLLAHTSAYSAYAPSVSHLHISGRNPYTGITGSGLVAQMDAFRLAYKPPYMYSRSDFGAAVLGAVISEAYDVDFYSIMTIFVRDELGLQNTYISTDSALKGMWAWSTDDAYIASFALTSTIDDLVSYARLYLTGSREYLIRASTPLCEVNADYSTGYLWGMADRGRVLTMSGETARCSSAIMIDLNNHTAAIVLSNYKADSFGSAEDIASALLNEISA